MLVHPVPLVPLTADAVAILERLRASVPLASVAVLPGTAVRLAKLWDCGRPIAGALEAIRAVEDRATDAGWTDEYKRDRLLAFVTQANKRAAGPAGVARTGPYGRAPPGTRFEDGTKMTGRGRVAQGGGYTEDVQEFIDEAEAMRLERESGRSNV